MWIPRLNCSISAWMVVKELVEGMLWSMTLCQISSFLRPMAAGMVALIGSSIVRQWCLRIEVAGVLSLVIKKTWWLVVNSMVVIRGFLMLRSAIRSLLSYISQQATILSLAFLLRDNTYYPYCILSSSRILNTSYLTPRLSIDRCQY
ncbi:hypothetical protein L873DRAFT_1065498 [Choiromyces venosus 120613-1]|uniref:Uncharacterized protein n=1 Tax=Choiromyces venosus 120613-1 TaxID=1336337 RepID=A0A3N4JII9_9PEZI|nr:hypothetical protein L873DRAFT_1065498 [Choiromyces venosus 120613-1]